MAAALRDYRLLGATGAAREEMLHGRKYLVVPVIALMEGVIHAVNSVTPEFVPADVLAKCAASWNGRPLVVFHPTQNGEQVSANSPEIIEQRGFGTIYASQVKGKRLSMEAWVDPERLKALGQTEMLADIIAGKPIEVSVGAGVAVAPEESTFNGRAYSGRWAYASGDHLAFLPGGKGACSIEMGCGAMRAASNFILDEEIFNLRLSKEQQNALLKLYLASPEQVKAELTALEAAERKPMADKRSLRSRLKALLPELKALMDTPEGAAAEEAAELIAYRSMRTMADGVGASWDEVSKLIDDLIADEEENPTETSGQEDAEETVETARLESIRMLCYSMMSSLQNIVSVTYAQTVEDIEPSDPRYAEAIRTAAGKEISSKNMKMIQAAHDASHSLHGHTTALGATCEGIKGLAGTPCGCSGRAASEGEDMTKKERIEAILKSGFSTIKDVKVLESASDEVLTALEASIKSLSEAEEKATKATADADAAKKTAADAEEKVKQLSAKPKTEEEYLRDAPESIKSLVSNHKAATEKACGELVAKLKGLGAYTEEELKAKSLEELTKLAALAKLDAPAVDFSLSRTIPSDPAARAASAATEFAPPDGYAAALKK